MKKLHIRRLRSGGIITNYNCTSRCSHCLYYCSPVRSKDYCDIESAGCALASAKNLGCSSLHIGGGEPFLDLDGLSLVLELASNMGMYIEYVETNSSWFLDYSQAVSILGNLKKNGLNMLLISISPFHNEYIPFYKVKGVLSACREVGINVFPWIMDFYPEIDIFDSLKPHKPEEYMNHFGKDYFMNIPNRYWIHFGGRSLVQYSTMLPQMALDKILSHFKGGCRELEDVSHFHIDLYGNYIPGLCSGLSINIKDLDSPINNDEYPFLAILYSEGVGALLKEAGSHYGFVPSDTYMSKCHLCDDIRHFIVEKKGIKSRDLSPAEFYRR